MGKAIQSFPSCTSSVADQVRESIRRYASAYFFSRETTSAEIQLSVIMFGVCIRRKGKF